MMPVQELAKALKRLSSFNTVAVLVATRAPIACGHAANVGISQLGLAPAVECCARGARRGRSRGILIWRSSWLICAGATPFA